MTSSLFIKQIPNHHDPFGKIEYVPPNAPLFSMRTAFEHLRRQRSCNKTYKPRQMSFHTSYITHTSCRFGLTFDHIHSDPMIQVEHVNTTQHLADILTYSLQFVSPFSGCESFIFETEQTCRIFFRCIGSAKQKPVQCTAMIVRK